MSSKFFTTFQWFLLSTPTTPRFFNLTLSNSSSFTHSPFRYYSSPSSSLFPSLTSPTTSSDQPSPSSKKSNHELTMQDHYELHLRKHHYQSDPMQLNAIHRFELLRNQLIQRRIQFNVDSEKKKKKASSLLSKWFSFGSSSHTMYKPLNGIYLYGSVGSGKTMLMDLFYNALPGAIQRKRTHFHSFMLDIHTKSHKLKQLHLNHHQPADPYSLYIQDVAKTTELICLDEFQVVHITDAMILRKLLEEFIQLGVVFVFTSNRHPSELYLNGLQRASFIPCIEFLQKHTQVINLTTKSDYRSTEPSRFRIFLYPDAYATSKLHHLSTVLGPFHPTTLTHSYHSLALAHVPNRAARVSFRALCEHPVATEVYQKLVSVYPIVLIDAFPRLSLQVDRNSMRRWITFVDIAYEAQTQCILHTPTAQFQDLVAMERGGGTDEEVFAWQRMVSRVLEMQTDGWVTDPDLRRVLDGVER